MVAVDGPDDVDIVARWCEATGNAVVAVHADAVEVHRGRIADPIAALAPERRPGYRLWIYTNFHCNLACDYCCVQSSPGAGLTPRRPHPAPASPRAGLTPQISLDSPDAKLPDHHRGEGSFARARAGITTAMELGFHVRVAATLGDDAGDTESRLVDLFDELGLEDDQRVVRRVAKQGSANAGLTVSRASLVPEVCLTADGVFWHPVAAIDPAMKVTESWSPLGDVITAISDECRAYRIRGDILAGTFPCA